MGLESGTYISDLVAANPAGGDGKSQGDDHLRLIKSCVKATFPNINGAVNASQAELNKLVAAGATQAALASVLGGWTGVGTAGAAFIAKRITTDLILVSITFTRTAAGVGPFAGQALGTLPAGWRPTYSFNVVGGYFNSGNPQVNGAVILTVGSDGTIVPQNGFGNGAVNGLLQASQNDFCTLYAIFSQS